MSAVTGESRTEQRAECEEGMPPESTMALKSQMPLRQRRVKICSAAEAWFGCTPQDCWCQRASGTRIVLQPVASELDSLQLLAQVAPSCYASDEWYCAATLPYVYEEVPPAQEDIQKHAWTTLATCLAP